MRGCERKVFYLKKCESEWFDEAYFVLKKDAPLLPSSGSMAEEALRIIQKQILPSEGKPKKKGWFFRAVLFFFLGSVFSALICGLLLWFV